MTKCYLGDSVYAEFNGFDVTLTTENGFGPSNSIVLEPVVLDALNRFVARQKELLRQEGLNNEQPPRV